MIKRVVVVDDSAFMRSELTKMLDSDPALQVVATAENGLEAIDAVKQYQPDVVTMDINMPVMDGISSLKQIMNEVPCPVIMVSAMTHDSADETIEALASGAFDFFQKPSGSISLDIAKQADIIRQKVKTAAAAKAKHQNEPSPWKRVVQAIPSIQKLKQSMSLPRESRLADAPNIVAIGVSTGGPKTLMSILPSIPADFFGSIIIAQHMPEKFTSAFAKRLDDICALRVKEAKDRDILQKGKIYIAPGGKHIRIGTKEDRFFTLRIEEGTNTHSFAPSVDMLFRSLLEKAGNQWLGVMLTGMGGDGATALNSLRQMGGHTIVESEESCVVFGMPRKVIELGGAEFILPEQEIAGKIIELIGKSRCH